MEPLSGAVTLDFVDKNPAVVAALSVAFDGVLHVRAFCGDILDAGAADVIVSPANSHGWMDGGIDLAYARRWPGLEERTQAMIGAQRGGLLPVGDALLVPTGDEALPWMACAPTMTEPMPVPDTPNAFLALRAALWVARDLPEKRFKPYVPVTRVLCPGLCTLTGRMQPQVAAWQMRAAWEARPR